MHIKIIQ